MLYLERLWNRKALNLMRQLGKRHFSKESEKGFGQMIAESLKGEINAHRFENRLEHMVRVIDNSKQCGLNDACSLPERFVLHGIDCFAAELIRSGAVPSLMAFRPWRQRCYPTTLNLKKRVNVGLPLELAPDVRSCEPDPSDRTFGCLPYSLFWGGPHLARYEVSHIDNETSWLALTEAYSSTELG